MERAARPSKVSRVDIRFRHLAQDISPKEESVRGREAAPLEEEEESPADADEPLLIREQKGRPVMGRGHRMFHRRQTESLNILTVAVEVVATVDSNGNVIAQETVTPALPSVPAVPTVPIPQVPSVPAFPSDLTVPAYPWPSGVPSVVPADVSSQIVISSPAPTSAPTAAITSSVPTFAPSLGFNSTISSSIPSSSFFSTTNSTSSTSSSSSRTSSSSSTRSSSTTTLSSSSFSSSQAATTSVYGGGGGGPAETAPAPAATTASTSNDSDDNSGSVLGTPETVGTVIGSLAGAALLLALLLFLIKRHKQKQRGLQLNDGTDDQPIAASGQQMSTTGARSSFVPAGAAAFLNRFSGASKSTADTSTTGERGFQRISGRKLPSAFSEGMTSEQFARGEGTLSGSSFYKDDQGFYGGTGAATGTGKEIGKETGEPSNYGAMGTTERIMPSPARTPVVHHPGEAPPWGTSRNGGSTLSPPHSPNPDFPPKPTLGRSHPSHDGSRSSRFTENV